MKKLGLVGIAFAALIATPAMAADMRVKAPVYRAPPPVASWTGFYIGANLGYGWEDTTVTFAGDNVVGIALVNPGAIPLPGGTPLPPASFKSKGAVGGFQAGYNWQVAPVWLVGFETDFNWSGVKGDGVTGNTIASVPAVLTVVQGVTAHRDVAWFGTLRGRLGWIATPSLLIYGTGGFAYGRVRENVTEVLNAPGFPAGTPISITAGVDNSGLACFLAVPCMAAASSRVATGWAAGGGAEFAVTPNISVKGEYLFVSLGSDSFRLVAPPAPGFAVPASVTASYNRVDLHTVRIGINYRFGGGPVYAAY